MDPQGHNLNRFYNSCAPHKHPSIFAISTLLQHYSEELVGFFDIHSHPQAKGSFAYGNAFQTIQDQIQSQTFAKLLSLNSQSFAYENCTFSQKNMNSKDINDILSKDGSARVCAYKKMINTSIHCYALELGYHGCHIKQGVLQNLQFKSQYRRTKKQFTQNDYIQFGSDVLNTLAQVYVQTYRGFSQSGQEGSVMGESSCNMQTQLHLLRQDIAKEIYEKDDRFRIMDGGSLKKIKNINNVIQGNLYNRIAKRYPNILEHVKEYDASIGFGVDQKEERRKLAVKELKNGKQRDDKNIKVIRSVQLASQNKKMSYQQHQILGEDRRLLEKLPKDLRDIRDANIKNLILQSSREKICVIPLQFQIPTARKSNEYRNFRRRDLNHNSIHNQHRPHNLLEIQTDSLPKIEPKKLNVLTERLRLKQKRVQSSVGGLNSHQLNIASFGMPSTRAGLQRKLFRGGSLNDKGTIESHMDDLVEYEKIVNAEEEGEFGQIQMEEFNRLHSDSRQKMYRVRKQSMFPSKQKQKDFINKDINSQTERASLYQNKQSIRNIHTNDRNRANSIEKAEHLLKPLTKLPYKVQKITNKFDLQLKMKQKYDKQYRLDNFLMVQGKKNELVSGF